MEEAADSTRVFAEAARDFTDTARRLPEEIESRLKAVIEEIDAKQAGVQGTLKEAKSVITEADRTFVRIHETVAGVKKSLGEVQEVMAKADDFSRSTAGIMESVSAAGEKWESAVRAFEEVVKELSEEEEPGTAESAGTAGESESFDIKDYERAAVKAREAAAEFRALTADVRAFVNSGRGTSVVKQTVLYLILLVVVFFVTLLGYRIAAARLLARR